MSLAKSIVQIGKNFIELVDSVKKLSDSDEIKKSVKNILKKIDKCRSKKDLKQFSEIELIQYIKKNKIDIRDIRKQYRKDLIEEIWDYIEKESDSESDSSDESDSDSESDSSDSD